MMRNCNSVILFIACLMTLASSKAQVLPGLQSNFINFQKAGLHEKLYVHTDRNFYLTGEILWLKIYNTDGATNKMIGLSKVAYVEILDDKHHAVLQAKIALDQGTGTGSFYIPFSLTNGNYQLRAYTSWMKNFDAGYFFAKQITIINPVKVSPGQPKPVSSAYDVQFFPEGGHLVKGLNSKIAFKVTSPGGKGADCTGAIINQQNDTVVRFKSLKFGIGSFNFTPSAQAGYKAVIKTGGITTIKELPEISSQGYVIQAIDHGAEWEVSVKNADSTRTSLVYLIVHNQHDIKQAESAGIIHGSTHFSINKSRLSEGLSYITLFDEQQRPLCERLIFKRPDRKLFICASTDDKVYDNRKKVNLFITTQDKDSKGIRAHLSLSVYRLDSLQNNDAPHIAGYLWLNGDLKGAVETPDYYIENNNEEANQAMDNLLLSQGWTQFDWSKILAGEMPRFSFLPEYTGPVITGKIINNQTELPANNITAYLTIAGTHHQLYTAKSDSAGKLLFNTSDFYGSNELFAQTQWQQDSIYRIDIVNPFSEQFSQQSLPPLNVNTGLKRLLASNSLNMQVQNIFTAKQLRQFNEPVADTALFYGKPTYTYLLDDYTRFPTIEDVIHEYVRLVVIARDHGKTGLQLINNDKITLPGQPLVLLDARPIFDVDKIFTVDPLKIKRLDVVSTNYVYGSAIFNGIISFTTYDGQSANIQLDQHTMVMDYDGLQLERKFYSPVYDSDQQISSSIPDFRNVLYWNPKADTDPQGQNKLSFYTGDKPGHYIGIIEGIAQGGEAGSQDFYFEVKSK